MKNKSVTTAILWVIYIFLLAVLLPHTAWAFRTFEPPSSTPILWAKTGTWLDDFTTADLVSYIAAIAFESAIAVLTHKLSAHIESIKPVKKERMKPDGTKERFADGWATFSARYVNAFSVGLIVSTVVSSLANLSHAVQFAGNMLVFTQWGIPKGVYVFAFGGILPFVSLLFARVLSNVSDTEGEEDPAIADLRSVVSELRRQGRETEARAKAAEAGRLAAEQAAEAARQDAEQQIRESEAKLQGAGELMRLLFAPEKRERIIAVKRQWPQLTGAAIALMTDSKPSYVSEVLSEIEVST